MLLGIPLHVAFAYTEIEYQWLIKDPQHSYFVDWGLYFLRIFRMPLFFIISGFFAHMMSVKRPEYFFIERTKRLFIPLLILFILIACPLKVLWLFAENLSIQGSYSFSSFWIFLQQNFFTATTSRFDIPPSWAHLWFLLYLYIFSLISIGAARLQWMKRLALPHSALLTLMIILSTLSFFLMESTWVDLPLGLLPKPSLLFFYGTFYFYGWQSFHLRNTSTSTWAALSILFVGTLLGVLRAYLEINLKLDLTALQVTRFSLYTLSCLSSWFISLGLIWSMKNLVSKESKIIKFFVDASYSIYLIHLPIIALLQLIFAQLSLHWATKLAAISLLTFVTTSLIYRFLIAKRWPEKFLQGKYEF